ncbi:MAG: stage III sporulation protein AA [Oscillospiraceae bacterium]|jgi:stage III sporulation protein AA|nr:stage III sporulation protein AA [Oscillospiraceae bacterium]
MKNKLKFEQAINCITPRIQSILEKLSDDTKENTQEIRLRNEKPVMLIGSYGYLFLNGSGRASYICTQTSLSIKSEELTDTFNRICKYSVHSNQSSIVNGYITIEGGHRAGICGTGVGDGQSVASVRDISSINLRVASQCIGSSDEIINKLFRDGLKSVIIAGAPLTGKTTILRDMARQISGGSLDRYYKTAIVDERKEIAAVKNGVPQNDVGINCDVLDMYPKGTGIMSALRSLSPEIIICDEVGDIDEIRAIEAGINSGVKFIASVHAESYKDIIKRPQIKSLVQSGAFDFLVLLKSGKDPGQISKIYGMDELTNEVSGNCIHYDFLCDGRTVFKPKIITKDKNT